MEELLLSAIECTWN